MLRSTSLLLLFFVAILIAILAYLNSEPVRFDYLFSEIQLPLSILMMICFVCGALTSWVVYMGIVMRLKKQLARTNKNISTGHK